MDPNTAFLAVVLLLGFAVSLLSGFLGIGGGIAMAPALLYLPASLGLGGLEMQAVTGLTITQGLIASVTGAVSHDRHGSVDRALAAWMGGGVALSALAGSVASRWVANGALVAVFAVLAALAAVLMWMPAPDAEEGERTGTRACRGLAVLGVALPVGFLCGMIGQGGSFVLIPLMIHVLGVPTRVAIGSNLAVVVCSSLAGFAGKVTTGQVPFLPAAFLVMGALPGAALGSALSIRTGPRWLRTGLAIVVGLAAVKMAADVVRHAGPWAEEVR